MWWFLFIFILAQNSFAEELKLNINGNKRTKDKIVRHIFEKCLENEIDHSDENLAQCLKNATIFSETKVIKTSDGYDIEVEDRWTLIPIPRVEADTAGDRRLGLGVVDSNFTLVRNYLWIDCFNQSIKCDTVVRYMCTHHVYWTCTVEIFRYAFTCWCFSRSGRLKIWCSRRNCEKQNYKLY